MSLRKGTIRVDDLVPGQEDRLRHFLESVIEQANVTHPPPEDGGQDDASGEPDETGPDAEMTERFRAFAG